MHSIPQNDNEPGPAKHPIFHNLICINLSSPETYSSLCLEAQHLASLISMLVFTRNAAEFLRVKKVLALFENELMRAGIEFVLTGSPLLNELTLFTMFSGAGLFGLGGQYGFPELERLCSGMGSKKEQVMR
jgi:hypothetical protein